MKVKRIITSVIILAVLVVGLILLVKHHQTICPKCSEFSIGSVKHFIEEAGKWGIIIYILLYMANSIILVPPIGFLSLSAGALFGPLWGTLALTLGAWAGTTATFIISRYFGGKLVDKFVKGKAEAFNKKLSKKGFVVLLPMRLIGFPPYELINYASGLSKISYKDYISATMIGMFPAILIQVVLVDRIANFSWKDPVLYGALVLFVAMGVITGKIIKKQQVEEAKEKTQKT